MKFRWTAGIIGIAAAGCAAFLVPATALAGQVDPPAGSSAYLVSGCSTQAQGTTCTYKFRFVNGVGQGEDGLSVTFSNSGPSGCTLQSTSGSTSGGGYVTVVLDCTAGSNTGSEVINAKSGSVSASANPTIVASGTQAASTGSTGTGLPFTGTTPPGPNPALIVGLGIAGMVLIGASVSLVRRRSTA